MRQPSRNPPIPASKVDAASAAPSPPRRSSGLVLSTVKYLMRTDVHTFAFSVAANSILSFFPFVMLMMTLIRRVFHSAVMYEVVVQLLRDYLPAGQDFVIRNLNAMVNSRQRVQFASLVILLVTSSGVFLPLEVALNRVWRFENNRSYLGNQLISLGLGFRLRSAGPALDRADCRPCRLHAISAARLRHRDSFVWWDF